VWFLGPLLKIGEYVAKTISSKLEHGQKMAEAKQSAELQVWMNNENAGALWAQTMAEASKTSWKDEWILVLFSLPMLLAMFGYYEPMQVIVDIIGQEMYRNIWLVMVGGSFGVRIWESYTGTKAANGGLAGIINKLPLMTPATPKSSVPADPMVHTRPGATF